MDYSERSYGNRKSVDLRDGHFAETSLVIATPKPFRVISRYFVDRGFAGKKV